MGTKGLFFSSSKCCSKMLSSKKKEKTDAKWENGCGSKVCSVMQNGKMVWVGGGLFGTCHHHSGRRSRLGLGDHGTGIAIKSSKKLVAVGTV